MLSLDRGLHLNICADLRVICSDQGAILMVKFGRLSPRFEFPLKFLLCNYKTGLEELHIFRNL
jgi:hypothetical protein